MAWHVQDHRETGSSYHDHIALKKGTCMKVVCSLVAKVARGGVSHRETKYVGSHWALPSEHAENVCMYQKSGAIVNLVSIHSCV